MCWTGPEDLNSLLDLDQTDTDCPNWFSVMVEMKVAFLYPPTGTVERGLCPNARAVSRASKAAEDAALTWATCLQHAVSTHNSDETPSWQSRLWRFWSLVVYDSDDFSDQERVQKFLVKFSFAEAKAQITGQSWAPPPQQFFIATFSYQTSGYNRTRIMKQNLKRCNFLCFLWHSR